MHKLCTLTFPTAGLADVRGEDQDAKNLDCILAAAQQLPHINTIIVVLNGTQARKTSELTNVFNKLRGTTPDAVLANAFLVCTMCRSEAKSPWRGRQLQQLPFTPKRAFYMENGAFCLNLQSYLQAQSPRAAARELAAQTEDWETSLEIVQV